jgi:non-canonical (house-cleaning) NTP pyrophosphatase
VGIEGGIEVLDGIMHAFAWMVVKSRTLSGEARTATFPLPPRIKDLVEDGMELGHADDLVFKRNNSKQKDGAVGILTRGIIDRARYYEHALILALIPFLQKELYGV